MMSYRLALDAHPCFRYIILIKSLISVINMFYTFPTLKFKLIKPQYMLLYIKKSKTIYLTLGCNVETNRVFENFMFITNVENR